MRDQFYVRRNMTIAQTTWRAIGIVAALALFQGCDTAPPEGSTPVGNSHIMLVDPPGMNPVENSLMEMFVPRSNRLLACYVSDADLQNIEAGEPLRRYALVQTVRRAENQRLTPNAFQEVIKGAQSGIQDFDNIARKSDLNERLKALDLEAMELGGAVQLGSLFAKDNIYNLTMVATNEVNGELRAQVAAVTMMRVNQRLISLYVLSDFEGQESVESTARSSEEWADAILAGQ